MKQMSHRRTPWLAALALVSMLAGSPALADAPTRLPIQGVLTDAEGTPIDGPTDLLMTLYDAEGGALFAYSTSAVLVGGAFSVYLGDATNPVDLALFRDHSQLELGVAVDGGPELTPRFPIATAPFAAFAQHAMVAEHALSAGAVAWSDVGGVPAGFADGVDADTLGGLSCANGQVAKFSGGGWSCGDDAASTYSPASGGGLSLSGTAFSVAAGGITNARLASDAVTSSKVADDAIDSEHLASNSVGSSEIASNAVGSSEIADNAVGSSEIASGAVGSSEIADDAVGRHELDDDIFTTWTGWFAECTSGDQSFTRQGADLCILTEVSGSGQGGGCKLEQESARDWTITAVCALSGDYNRCGMACFTW